MNINSGWYFMSVPGYQEFMYPILRKLGDNKEYRLKDLYSFIADEFNLSEEDIQLKLPSGRQSVLNNRVSWAKTYLTKAGLLKSVKRGVIAITDEGQQVLSDPEINKINRKFLLRYKNFREFQNQVPKEEKDIEITDEKEMTPLELIEENHRLLKNELQDELLDKIMSCSPTFFENLIVELIVSMGYGGSVQDAGKAIGKSGDEGIDGIIKEDVLGLEMIFLQAKRWNPDGAISRPEIQSFVGSLVGRQASKGLFITTAKFTKGAIEYAEKVDKRVILIDGQQLTDLMFNYNVGVVREMVFTTKKIDAEFFEE
ncbi:restriction endonuclease [Salinicoccus roseus]|nr:restriction endonuclease [Salinicoccus roseus]